MKKIFPLLLVLGLFVQACNFPAQPQPIDSPTLPASPAPTIAATPIATLSSTPTLIPTFTPTPAPEVRIASADHAFFNGDYDTALSEYTAALANSTDPAIDAAAIFGQGRIHYLQGDYPNALSELRNVTNQFPGSTQAADAYYFLGETYMQLDRFSEAADAFASYQTIRPGILDAFMDERRGDAYTAGADYTSALASYISATQSPRLATNFLLELKLAQTYSILGDFDTASVIYNDIFSRTNSDDIKAQVDYAQGQMASVQGEVDQATAFYVDAVFNYPYSYYSYLSLVELVDSGYPVSELQRGLVDYNAGQYGVALAAFDRYIDLNPSDSATAQYYKGLILRKQQDLSTAISLWDDVIQGDPTSAVWDSAWEQKAYTQWAYQEEYAAAQQTLLDFVEQNPAHARAAEFLYDAGRVAERDNRLEDAAKIWQRIPAEYPNSDYVFRSLFLAGISYYRMADYPSAISIFDQVKDLATTPTNKAAAYFWLGKAQSAQGDADSAQTTWQQAASIDPTGYYSERARDTLNDRLPFSPPASVDLVIDHQSELRQAELWMYSTFNYPTSTDLSVPGPLANDPRFIRGQEFWRLGLTDQAEAEFNSIREDAISDPITSYRLAVYLSDLGIYRQAILAARQVLDLAGLDDAGTLTAPVLFSHIRFGAYFSDLIASLAQDNGFDPLFVWSTVRQESLFDPSIQSSAGAYGLMQVLPVTGEEIVARIGWPTNYSKSDLLRPMVNLTLGQDYLATQRDALDGDLYAALAAYNGGPGNAVVWQSLANGDPDLFIEVVRFDETRQYLMGIYEVFNIYSRLYARVP
jgi:soluble lytic murein transglycosylase